MPTSDGSTGAGDGAPDPAGQAAPSGQATGTDPAGGQPAQKQQTSSQQGGTPAGEDGLPDNVKEILRKERQAAREAKAEADQAKARAKQLEDAQLSEQDRITRDLETARTELQARDGSVAKLTSENLRLRVALDKGLSLDLAERLRGDDEAAMAADADRLVAQLGGAVRTPNFDAGARGTADPTLDMNARLRHLAGRG